MSEYDTVDYCPACENLQVFTCSGSGKKQICNECVTLKPIAESYKIVRLENEW